MAARTTSPKATGWVLGTVFVAILLAVGAWFFVISPIMDQTAEARDQTESIQASNHITQVRIDRLKDQFANLEQYKAELASLRSQIPTQAQQAEYLRELDVIAEATGVTVTALGSTVGQLVVPAVVAPAPVEEIAPSAAEEPSVAADGAAPAAPEVPEGPVVPDGFVAIPVSITVVGPYEKVVAFVGQLQNGTQRLFLLSSFIGTAQEEADAASGRPATAEGDLEIAVSGFTYVLMDPVDPVIQAAEVAPSPLPGAVPGKNPLLAAGG